MRLTLGCSNNKAHSSNSLPRDASTGGWFHLCPNEHVYLLNRNSYCLSGFCFLLGSMSFDGWAGSPFFYVGLVRFAYANIVWVRVTMCQSQPRLEGLACFEWLFCVYQEKNMAWSAQWSQEVKRFRKQSYHRQPSVLLCAAEISWLRHSIIVILGDWHGSLSPKLYLLGK